MRYASNAPIETSSAARVLPQELWRDRTWCWVRPPVPYAENKRYSFAIHYRAAPQIGASLRVTLRDFVAANASYGLQIFDAHFAYEIKAGHFDKGMAIDNSVASAVHGPRPRFCRRRLDSTRRGSPLSSSPGGAPIRWQNQPEVTDILSGPAEVRERLGQLASQMALS